MSREDPWTSPVPNQMLRLDLPNGPPWIQSGLTATCTVDRAGPFFNAQPLKTAFEPRPCQMPWKSPFDLSEKGSHPPLEMRPTNEYLNDRNHDSRFFPQTQTRWQNQGPFSWPELAMVPVPDGATTVPVNTTAGYLPNAPIGTSALAPAMYPLGPNSGIGFGHWPMPNGTMQLFVQANPPSPEPKERPESYAKVIYDALLEADSNVLTLQEIYDWIEQRTDKAKGGSSKGWKNSVRHNLTVNGAFRRVIYTQNEKKSKKEYAWRLDSAAVKDGVLPTTRYRRDRRRSKSQQSSQPDRKDRQDRHITSDFFSRELEQYRVFEVDTAEDM